MMICFHNDFRGNRGDWHVHKKERIPYVSWADDDYDVIGYIRRVIGATS